MTDHARLDQIPLPALLRGARRTYGEAIVRAMRDAGLDDLPRNGAYVLGAIANAGLPLSRIIEQLGVSKQTAGQLVDTLVSRGYLERAVDPADRRRLVVSLTDRGEGAAAVARDAVARVDAALVARLGATDLACARRVLFELIETGTHEAYL